MKTIEEGIKVVATNRRAGFDYELGEIMVGNGAKQLIFNAFMATLEPGDEVIVPAPCYASYADMARSVGGKPVMVACPQNNGFRLRLEDLEAAITMRTRWVVLNSPNNPTGTVFTSDEATDSRFARPNVARK